MMSIPITVRPELILPDFPRKSVRPELVEGLFFVSQKEGQGFDKLSPNVS